MRRYLRSDLAIAVGALLACAISRAEELPSVRAALSEARAALLDELDFLPLTASSSVLSWAARDEQVARELRRWVLTLPAAGPPRLFRDGVCEVDVRVTPGELREALRRLRPLFATADPERITDELIAESARHWPNRWSSGVVRAGELPGELPPPGWEDLAEEQIELARRAAAAEARQMQFENAARLKVTNARLLRDFFEVSAEITAAVRERLEDLSAVRVALLPERIATAEARLSLEELIDILIEVRGELYAGEAFTDELLREIPLYAAREELVGLGLAVPPGAAPPPDDCAEPTWSASSLRAIGVGGAGLLLILPEAALESLTFEHGTAGLWALVERLPVRPGWTVGELVLERPALRDDLKTCLAAARALRRLRPSEHGAVRVEYDLPLASVWRCVRVGGPLPPPREPAPTPAPPVMNPPATTAPAASQPAAPGSLPPDADIPSEQIVG